MATSVYLEMVPSCPSLLDLLYNRYCSSSCWYMKVIYMVRHGDRYYIKLQYETQSNTHSLSSLFNTLNGGD